MLIGERITGDPRNEEIVPGRCRKTYRLASCLRFANRERPHRSVGSNSGEIGTRPGDSALSVFLRGEKGHRVHRVRPNARNWFSGWPATSVGMAYKPPAKRSPSGASILAVVT